MKTIVETIAKKSDYNDEMVITISHLGFIERTPKTEIHSLIHGCDDNKLFYIRENDFVEYVSLANMQSSILFFTSLGRCYWLKVCDIPERNNNSNEYTIQNLLKIEVGDSIKAFILAEDNINLDFAYSHYIVFCTKNGIVKRTCMMDYVRLHNGNIRPCKNGIRAVNISEGDTLVNVVVTNGNKELMLASSEGRAIRFNELDIRLMGRTGTGVRGMCLNDDKDEIVGIIHTNDVKTESVMFICDNGYGIRTNLEEFRITRRGNSGLKTMSFTDETAKVIAITTVTDDTDLIVFNKSGVINRIKVRNVPIKGRATRGVKLIENFPESDQIVCVLKVYDFCIKDK